MRQPLCSYLPLHASAAHTPQGAWIFLGRGGTGKSTTVQLLSDQASPLADDKIYLLLRDEHWIVIDAGEGDFCRPLSEKEAVHLDGPPLRAIFQLHQAPDLHLEPLPPLETCQRLVESFFELPWNKQYDQSTKKRAFASLAAVARSVPGYRLYSNRSPHTYTVLDSIINL